MSVETNQTSVMLVDDHKLVRAGVRALIEDIDGFSVIAESSDVASGYDLIQHLQPEIVITDISMPVETGIGLLERIRSSACHTKVLVLSMHATIDHVLSALCAGASGYLVKDAPTVELELALLAVRDGDIYLSPGICGSVVEQLLSGGACIPRNLALCHEKSSFRATVNAPQTVLTPRQSQVLKSIANGMSTKEIAFDLQISPKTVETYKAQVMQRLGIRDIAGLALYAARTGLVAI
jgi:DNA-binding NarL/FixJ family response regulator